MKIEERIRQVDRVMGKAAVSLAHLSIEEINLAHDLCEHFDLPLGTLMRRADAIRLLGGAETVTDELREAAQHLVYR